MSKVTDVVELTSKQLEDYVSCPNKFYLKNVAHIDSNRRQNINKIISDVRDNIMYTLMEGKIPTSSKINKLYNKLILDNGLTLTAQTVLHGSAYVMDMWNWCCDNQLRVADIGTPFELPFHNSNTILKGNFGIIRYNKDALELLVIEPMTKIPDEELIRISLRYTIQAYALHKLVKQYEMKCIRIVLPDKHKELTTYRTLDDFARLEATVDNVATAIRNKIYYPRESWECTKCHLKAYCGGLTQYDAH